ncbi:MAG: hypothetical protein KGL25_08640 [Gammaproteobacteria bacterium]|nr:hypothetical protein [Gammaproteobacteria bacterium]
MKRIHASLRRQLLHAVALLLVGGCAAAEPYIAVQQGLPCGQCHFNPTGSGLRTAVGNAMAQNVLPAQHVAIGANAWTGEINSFIAAGGDLRTDANWTNAGAARTALGLEQARLYLGISAVPDRVLLYLDEQVAPDTAVSREAWAMYRFGSQRWYLRAGRMVLPYGLRLQDQQAFVRQVAGINMDTPDNALELGYRAGDWDAQFAVSNGAAGGSAADSGKQYTAQLVRLVSRWRIGLGMNRNDSSGQQSRATSLFAGARTGPVTWLAEADLVNTRPGTAAEQRIAAALLEADWRALPGANLKLTSEWLDPDRRQGGDLRARYSVVAEYTPIQYLQLRLGLRTLRDAAAQAPDFEQGFFQVHVYF